MALGPPGFCKPEEAQSKLLLAEAPPGVYGPKQLGERFALWSAGSYEVLLARAEAGLAARQRLLTPHRKTAQCMAAGHKDAEPRNDGQMAMTTPPRASGMLRGPRLDQLAPDPCMPRRCLAFVRKPSPAALPEPC